MSAVRNSDLSGSLLPSAAEAEQRSNPPCRNPSAEADEKTTLPAQTGTHIGGVPDGVEERKCCERADRQEMDVRSGDGLKRRQEPALAFAAVDWEGILASSAWQNSLAYLKPVFDENCHQAGGYSDYT